MLVILAKLRYYPYAEEMLSYHYDRMNERSAIFELRTGTILLGGWKGFPTSVATRQYPAKLGMQASHIGRHNVTVNPPGNYASRIISVYQDIGTKDKSGMMA